MVAKWFIMILEQDILLLQPQCDEVEVFIIGVVGKLNWFSL